MIVSKEFINKLKEFGLNSYEAKLWTALLSRGISTAGELSEIAGVPRSRTYDVLESLEKKGFIVMKIGKPIKFIALPPNEVVERVKKRVLEDAERRIAQFESNHMFDIIKELNILHSQGISTLDPIELTGCVKGRKNLYAHIESRMKDAEKEVILITTEQGLIRKSGFLKRVLKKLKKKNVQVKIFAPLTKKTKEIAKELQDLAKISNTNINSRIVIIDSKEVIFSIVGDDAHPSYDTGVWVTSEFFANTLKKLITKQ